MWCRMSTPKKRAPKKRKSKAATQEERNAIDFKARWPRSSGTVMCRRCSMLGSRPGIAKMCDMALHRSYLVLETLGYSPTSPPPDTKVAVN
jgi:hypothetical protein